METNQAPKVYAAIAAVMSAMSKAGIAKDRQNVQQKYAFRGIDDVYNALSSILAEHRLMMLPNQLERVVTERKSNNGGVLFSVTVKVEFTFVCADDGSSHKCVMYGEAMDSGDKATNKAASAAFKYAAMQAFCIPTEGDNDADAHTHQVAAQAMKPADIKRHVAAIKGAKTGEALKAAFEAARVHASELNDADAYEQFKAARQEVIDAHTKHSEPADAEA
jgi:hypothetical protein